MDPVALATTIVGLLAPYLPRLGERVLGTLTDRATDAVPGVIERLYQALKRPSAAWLVRGRAAGRRRSQAR
jgi:hypothetical protein